MIEEIEALKNVRRHSAEHIRWLTKALRFLEQVFGQGSRYYLTLADIPWHRSGSFLVSGGSPQASIDRTHQEAYVNQLDSAKGLLQAAADELATSDLAEVYVGKDTGPESSLILRILTLVERKLRKVLRERPESEKTVQDAVENLLIGADIEYSREVEAIEYSSKTYRPDFSFQKLGLALEVKFCGRDDREKQIIAEINDDILAYTTKYRNAVFVVYDCGFIRDIERFARNFEEHEGVVVRVVKH